jgi:uncharacterized Zn finger protein (UPF0148 family)
MTIPATITSSTMNNSFHGNQTWGGTHDNSPSSILTTPNTTIDGNTTTIATGAATTTSSSSTTTTTRMTPSSNSIHSRDPISLLGDYMLRGWVLMGDTCRSCPTIPLVFNKREQIYLCVQCEQRYLPETPSSSSINNEMKTSLSSTRDTHQHNEESTRKRQQEEETVTTMMISSPSSLSLLPSNDSHLMNQFYRELQSTLTSLCVSSSITEKLSIIDLLEREWRVYQSFLSVRKISP